MPVVLVGPITFKIVAPVNAESINTSLSFVFFFLLSLSKLFSVRCRQSENNQRIKKVIHW